jgi:hypothetical protein
MSIQVCDLFPKPQPKLLKGLLTSVPRGACMQMEFCLRDPKGEHSGSFFFREVGPRSFFLDTD